MSPFEAIAHRLGIALQSLSKRAQVAVLLCSARAFMPQYLEWSAWGGDDDQSGLLGEALDVAAAFAVGVGGPSAEGLLTLVEAAIPVDTSDVPGFTTAQDCWICADLALRVSLGAFAVEDAAWYILEPIFQSTSERLFGVSDVGSQAQGHAEAEVLSDPVVLSAVGAVEGVIELLTSRPSPDVGDLDHITDVLRSLNP